MNAPVDALARQLFGRAGGGAEEQVGAVVGEHAVVLLRHGAVEAAQAGLHVRHAQPQLGCGQCAGQRGVRVAVHQHPIRLLGQQHLLQADQHVSRLPAVAARPDAQRVVGPGHAELLEEEIGHLAIVVLAGVNQHLGVGLAEGAADGRSLDELRPGPGDGHDFHGIACLALAFRAHPGVLRLRPAQTAGGTALRMPPLLIMPGNPAQAP